MADAVSWWDGRMVTFDVETTGTDPLEARIVQAAVAFVGAGEPTEEWSILIDPGVEIPDEAAEIHGITTERARAEGVSPEVGIRAIVDELARREGGQPLVVFNAPYDLTVLGCEMVRIGLPSAPVIIEAHAQDIIDPLVIDQHLERYRRGSRKLIDTCRYYRAPLGHAHDACYDAIAAARLAWRLGRSGEVVRRARGPEEAQELYELQTEWYRIRGDLPALHAAQQRWALRAQAELEEYLHKGNPRKDVPPQPDRVVPRGWPILPITDVSSPA